MRLFPLLALLVLAGGCENKVADSARQTGWDAGWHYTRYGGKPGVYYGFGPREVAIVGTCDAFPIFSLVGGDYRMNVKRFTVAADGWRQEFDAFQGEHGRSLPLVSGGISVEDQRIASVAFEERLSRAHSQIAIVTDDGWQRALPPSPMVGRFAHECVSWRKKYPNA